jgi:SAM-dependent methyltransferase
VGHHPLPLTGERTLPGIAHENYWFTRHVVAYRFAAARAAGRRVLDAGCGEGYGTAMLAGVAEHAVGVDLDAATIDHARRTYPSATFIAGNLTDLPLGDASVDLIVGFQVIEHLWDIPRCLDEVVRVLRPGGEFLCATPNRLTFTASSDAPTNPFHTVELAPDELRDTLARRFRVPTVLGVHHGWRLAVVERLARRSVPGLQIDRPPEAWPRWLRRVVAQVTPDDFVVRADRLATSLDLLAIATKPGEPA